MDRKRYTAVLRMNRSHAVDPDDWDQRPENICKKCGYKIPCVCVAQHGYTQPAFIIPQNNLLQRIQYEQIT